MRGREIGFAFSTVRRSSVIALCCWSLLEVPSSALSGIAVAHALDDGFLRHRTGVGLTWIAVLLAAATLAALGARRVFALLGNFVEPLRDVLVRRVVDAAVTRGVAGERDGGAAARLTRQVETVRDSFAGIIIAVRGFVVTALGTAVGALALGPLVAVIVMPPFVVGFGLFLGVLRVAAERQRASVLGEEKVAAAAGPVLAAVRDIAAGGTERYAADLVGGPVLVQAGIERALARVAALRQLCFAIGGWLPALLLLMAGPALLRHGLTAGDLVGGLTFVVSGIQPALRGVMSGLGDSGLRFSITLARLLQATEPVPQPTFAPAESHTDFAGEGLALRGVTFAYGPASEPVLRDLDLTVEPGDHLAVVGPSGIGKSTMAALICGLRPPDAGTVLLGGIDAASLPPDRLAGIRVLIPQEAYVFAGSLRENLAYLAPQASDDRITASTEAVGADALLARLGGLDALLVPNELSAGERQLLALARAHLSPAPLAVLDEATCHLDPVAERRAEQAFADRGGTLIVIAHRLSSALRAERVLVLDGVRADAGSHEELSERSALYRELLAHWSAGSEPVPAAGSDPALVAGDAHGLDAAARAGLGDGPRQIVANSAVT
ncbi:ABC transporter related [Catenulispora acidiphila DSM 44928]|uniref:ABC transporter related n=1 Tax=Catenulispora acidiphila (strain DSM 44928 / JCM 14897 / NBRC 102108 / NRRL B-24433 / ID139908) TaxID=479433 RepID=C7QI62_CATAD|nr:ABC transporter ATP-binding protein [Catenulispora acidiphila]ACU73107.1 ABC transporter related [Catenulispora acidiphila DSM 44928]